MSKVTLGTKQVTVTTHGTAVALASSSLYVSALVIKGLTTNTKSVFIAPNGTAPATQGFELEPGADYEFGKESQVDLSVLKLDSIVNGEGVSLSWNNNVG